jgi:predicted metal-dependent peptidase
MSNDLHPQLQRCYDLAIAGAWKHPFFLIPIGAIQWHEAKDPERVKTMMVHSRIVGKGSDATPEINMYVNTEWVKGLPDKQVFGVLCHEIMHSLLHHHKRAGGKNLDTWGQATDMAINASLLQSGIELPEFALKPPQDHYDDAAEELYSLLDTGEITPPKGYNPEKATAGCQPSKSDPGDGDSKGDEDEEKSQGGGSGGEGDQESDGEGEGSGGGGDSDEDGEGDQDGQGSGSGDSGEEDRVWGEMVAQCAHASRGTGAAKVMARVFAPKPSKTRWERLLMSTAQRASARAGRDQQTFKRVNRRSEEIIFPGWESKRPSIAAIIDSSGSVSDEMLRSALTSVKACAKVSGVKIFLVLHAWDVYFADWIKPETTVEEISKLCSDRGGTNANPAFEALAAAKGKFDSAVYLTDGEVGQYPDKPDNTRNMIVGIVGDRPGSYRAQVPDTWREIMVDIE